MSTRAEVPNTGGAPEVDVRASWRGIAGYLGLMASTALGACAALALNMFVLMPALGVGNVERIVALGRHIDAGASPAVVTLGNSVTVEGIDAGAIADELGGGASAENWGINGAAVEEVRLTLPKVLSAGPRFVVLSLLPNDLATPEDIQPEKAYGYGVGGFDEAWPAGDPRSLFPGITGATVDRMRASAIEQAVYFRSAPLDWLNREVRQLVRSGIREVPPHEWRSPFELTESIGGGQLDQHVRGATEALRRRAGHRDGSGAADIARAAEMIARAGATAVVCIAPQHPAMREAAAPELADLRTCLRQIDAMPGVVTLDASELFGAEGFADALHLNATGREAYSRALGALIAGAQRSGEGR